MKTRIIPTLLLLLAFSAGSAQAKGRDVNGDGTISAEEFLANRKHPEKARGHFEKADTNHDGSLDRSERAAMKRQHGKHHKKGLKHGHKKHA